MEEFDGQNQLIGHLSDLVDRIGLIVVIFEKIENARAEHLESDANMTVVVEPIQHLHTSVFATRVVFCKLLQDVDFELGCLAILFDVLDDFERHHFVFKDVFDLDHLAKCAFPKSSHDFETVL